MLLCSGSHQRHVCDVVNVLSFVCTFPGQSEFFVLLLSEWDSLAHVFFSLPSLSFTQPCVTSTHLFSLNDFPLYLDCVCIQVQVHRGKA